MKRANILVEGQSEELFVKRILVPYFAKKNVWINPIILTTKRVKTGSNFKGGVVSYIKTKREVQRLLGDANAVLVTTMFDFYGLPHDFPSKAETSGKTGYECVQDMEGAFKDDIGDQRFVPYIQLYEFEALLFSSTREIAAQFFQSTTKDFENLKQSLDNILKKCRTPEEIDDSPQTSPSNCLLKLVPTYQKTLHGVPIAKRIGLNALRAQCHHFQEWLKKIETLVE